MSDIKKAKELLKDIQVLEYLLLLLIQWKEIEHLKF